MLEHIWLPVRHEPNGAFYKGLIQLAGAFVHLQKNRPRSGASLFKLARAKLQKYPATYEHLDVSAALELIANWLQQLESRDFTLNPLTETNRPSLHPLPRQPVSTFLIATRNAHKVEEIRAILAGPYRFVTLRDFPGAPEVVEDASTFAGNATKKAAELARWIATSGPVRPNFHSKLRVSR